VGVSLLKMIIARQPWY